MLMVHAHTTERARTLQFSHSTIALHVASLTISDAAKPVLESAMLDISLFQRAIGPATATVAKEMSVLVFDASAER